MNAQTNPTTFNIGAAVEGGTFAGIIQIDGSRYGVVVAPKATGETEGPWGEYGKRIPADSLADGLANTQAMAEAGNEIATWALALTIDNHADWYIPSRDELELIYRNLKPGTRGNICSYRDGENPSSVPFGELYTDENPAQTPVAAFQSDGEEAMEPSWYWSSTQSAADHAFGQAFSDGYQYGYRKDGTLRVRAVRRFLID